MHHKDLVRAIKWPIWCIWFVLMRFVLVRQMGFFVPVK